MKWMYVIIAAAFLAVGGRAVVSLADDATTQPTDEPATHHHHKIVAPFNLLTDLTDDQKSQIAAIHKDESAKEKALRAQEHDDIMALLTDDQKKELDDAISKEGLEHQAESEENRAKEDEAKAQELKDQAQGTTPPATQPAGN